jgi:hypothetical protein
MQLLAGKRGEKGVRVHTCLFVAYTKETRHGTRTLEATVWDRDDFGQSLEQRIVSSAGYCLGFLMGSDP